MSTLFSFGFKKDGAKSSSKKRPLNSSRPVSTTSPIAGKFMHKSGCMILIF